MHAASFRARKEVFVLETSNSRASLIATLTTTLDAPLASGLSAGATGWRCAPTSSATSIPRRCAPPSPASSSTPCAAAPRAAPSRARPSAASAASSRPPARYDLVDLEMARDLTPDILKAIPPEKRRDLLARPRHPPRRRCRPSSSAWPAVDAALYKLVPAANAPGEELPPLLLLAGPGAPRRHRLRHRDRPASGRAWSPPASARRWSTARPATSPARPASSPSSA